MSRQGSLLGSIRSILLLVLQYSATHYISPDYIDPSRLHLSWGLLTQALKDFFMYHARIGHDSATVSADEPEQLDSDTAHPTAAGKQAPDEHEPIEASPTLPDSAAAAEESSGPQASAPETGADEVEEVPCATEQPEDSASAANPGQANALALIKKNNFELGESKDVFGCLENIRQSFEFSMDRCSRCATQMRLFKGQLKSKTAKVMICDKCNRAATMLSRHVTWPPEEWSSLSSDMISAFWQNAGSIQEDGKLDWKKLKVVLITALSQAIHHEKRSQVSEKVNFCLCLGMHRRATTQQGSKPTLCPRTNSSTLSCRRLFIGCLSYLFLTRISTSRSPQG